MKCVKPNSLNFKYVSLALLFSLPFLFYEGKMGSDDLQAFDVAILFVNQSIHDINFSEIWWQLIHRKIWIIQDYAIISITKFLNQIVNFNYILVSKYFCGWIISFYFFLSIFFFLELLYLNTKNFFLSLLVALSIFFGSSLISFSTGSLIESLVIMLIVLRFVNAEKLKTIFFIDIILCLIKPYYILIVFALELSNKNSLLSNIKHLAGITIIIFLEKIVFFKFFKNFLNDMPFEFNTFSILENFFDMLFSPGFGAIFTSATVVILIIIGREKNTLVKLFFLLIFMIFLSTLPFWHGQSSGGRYLISSFAIFIPEFINSIKVIDKIKGKKNIIIFILTVITILNLPSLEFRNTNIKNYTDRVVQTQIVIGVSDKDKNAFPNKSYLFNNIFFSQIIFINKALNKSNKKITIEKYTFNINDVYPMTGLGRIIYIIDNKLSFLPRYIFNNFKIYISLLKFIYYSLYLSIFSIIIYSFYRSINEKN